MDNAFVVDVLGPGCEVDVVPVGLDARKVEFAVLPAAEGAVANVAAAEVWLHFGRLDEED